MRNHLHTMDRRSRKRKSTERAIANAAAAPTTGKGIGSGGITDGGVNGSSNGSSSSNSGAKSKGSRGRGGGGSGGHGGSASKRTRRTGPSVEVMAPPTAVTWAVHKDQKALGIKLSKDRLTASCAKASAGAYCCKND